MEARPASGGEIARNALWRLSEVIGSELLAFGFMVFLARLLLPEDYGVVAIASVFLMVAQMTVYHGLAEAIIQRLPADDRCDRTALWTNLIAGALLTLIIAVISHPVAALLDKPLLGPILLGMSPITLAFGITGIYQAKVRRELQIKVLAVRTLVSVVLGGAVGTTMALSGAGAWSLVGQQLAHAFGGAGVLIWLTGWRPSPLIDTARLMEMARFGWHVMITFLLDMFSRNITTIILGYFLTAGLVGHFFIANRIFFSLGMLTFMSVNELCLPILARLQRERSAHIDGIYRCFRLTALVCLPSYLGLSIIAEPVVLALFGEAWQGAVMPLFVLCLFGIVHGYVSLISQIFLSLDKPERASELTLVTGILLIILVVPAASFGLLAATIAMGCAYLLVLPYALWRLSRVMPLNLRKLCLEQLPIWLASAVMLGLALPLLELWLGGQPAFLQLLTIIPASALAFVASLRLFTPTFFAEVTGSLRDGLGRKQAAS